MTTLLNREHINEAQELPSFPLSTIGLDVLPEKALPHIGTLSVPVYVNIFSITIL